MTEWLAALARRVWMLLELLAGRKGAKGKPAQGGSASPEPAPEKPAPDAGGKMPEGIQRDFPHAILRKYGCYFFALLRWAQELSGAHGDLSNMNIVSLFLDAQRQMMPNPKGPGVIPIITQTAFVSDPVRLLNFLAGRAAVSRVSLWTNDFAHPAPDLPIFIRREAHPAHGAHFLLDIGGRRWDSLPLGAGFPRGLGL